MSNHNVPIKIFASPRVQRSYDRRDETRVVDLIRREVLPKTKAAYHSISVKIRRGADGSPKSLIVYLLRQDTYTAEVKKIEVDQDYNVQAIQDDYDESQDPEDTEADDAGARYAPDVYGPVDFIAATPVPEIPTAKQAVEHLHQLALNAGLRSRMLLGPQASVANYQGYLRSGVQGFVNIGHGFTAASCSTTAPCPRTGSKASPTMPSRVL